MRSVKFIHHWAVLILPLWLGACASFPEGQRVQEEQRMDKMYRYGSVHGKKGFTLTGDQQSVEKTAPPASATEAKAREAKKIEAITPPPVKDETTKAAIIEPEKKTADQINAPINQLEERISKAGYQVKNTAKGQLVTEWRQDTGGKKRLRVELIWPADNLLVDLANMPMMVSVPEQQQSPAGTWQTTGINTAEAARILAIIRGE
ncbi:MAG: hypothetical protein ACOYK8_04275 [Alphaproteobacteria bacterium]